jgi:hypothetical protein
MRVWDSDDEGSGDLYSRRSFGEEGFWIPEMQNAKYRRRCWSCILKYLLEA